MRYLGLLRCLLGIVTVTSAAGSMATEQRPPIKACTEDDDSFPWVLKDRSGVTTFQLKLVEKQLGTRIEMTPLPWKRCMAEVQIGLLDAAIKISYSETRAAELGVFPMRGGKVDASKRLHFDSYSLYRLKGSSVSWDGKVLRTNGTIGAQTGFSIISFLQTLGVKIDEGARSADDHLRKLLLARISAVALQTQEGDNSVASNEQFRDRIERIEPVLIEKPYFMMFSKQFYAKNPAYVQEVWNAIEVARESAEYKKYLQGGR